MVNIQRIKKLCSDCKAKFEISLEDKEEGDSINCPECNLEYTLIFDKKGKTKLVETKELEMEEEEEGEEESEDYDSD